MRTVIATLVLVIASTASAEARLGAGTSSGTSRVSVTIPAITAVQLAPNGVALFTTSTEAFVRHPGPAVSEFVSVASRTGHTTMRVETGRWVALPKPVALRTVSTRERAASIAAVAYEVWSF
jgi:hypothetical protein